VAGRGTGRQNGWRDSDRGAGRGAAMELVARMAHEMFRGSKRLSFILCSMLFRHSNCPVKEVPPDPDGVTDAVAWSMGEAWRASMI